MRVTTPEINWHNRDPVYSVDFSPHEGGFRLASCGTDCFVRLWSVTWGKKTAGGEEEGAKAPTPTKGPAGEDEEEVLIDHKATLVRHAKAVNVVRFSADGRVLASAGEREISREWNEKKNEERNKREEKKEK